MRTKIFIFFAFLCFNKITFSQVSAQFEFTLKVEDKNGNIDSVILGYDTNAIFGTIDTIFGESAITNQPFDSVLEIRASPDNFNDNPFKTNQSKKQIVQWSCGDSTKPATIWLSIRTEELPFTIHWDGLNF